MKWLRVGSLALLMFAFVGCDLDKLTDLAVENQNDPDRARALAEAGDIESLIAGSFLIWFEHVEGGFTSDWGSPAGALTTAADEVTMSWGNFGMQQLSSEPRVEWPNDPSWRYRNHVQAPWYGMYEALSSAYDGLVALQTVTIAEELGPERTVRAQAFAKFVQGMAHGWLSLMFDSAFIFDETVDLETDQLTLQPYPAVWAAARGYFDEAISLANANSFTLPSTWINGNALTNTELVQLIHSQLARWIPQVARTPAQRDAVDWAEVISHVDQGITSDFFIQGDGGAPADGLWGKPQLWWTFESNPIWGRADYKTIGPADSLFPNSGGYKDWLATPVAQRTEFELETADLRIVGPAGGRDPGTDFEWIGPSFFRPDRGTYHFSQYRGTEYNAYVANGFVGPMIYMTVTEMQLTKAEGLLRGGNAAAAVAIINNTRVNRGGLPPATATDTDLMDKLIYEKRIENYGVCVGCAYWDRRGWGQLAPTGPAHHNGLVEGTPLHFAMPGKEMEILQFPVYSYGGVGNEGMALSVVAGAPPAPDAGPGSRAPAKLVYAFKGLNSVDEKLQYVDEHLREARGTFAVH